MHKNFIGRLQRKLQLASLLFHRKLQEAKLIFRSFAVSIQRISSGWNMGFAQRQIIKCCLFFASSVLSCSDNAGKKARELTNRTSSTCLNITNLWFNFAPFMSIYWFVCSSVCLTTRALEFS